MPSAGRWVANFSGRCTPPPPAGGKYIVTSRTFMRSRAMVERVARVLVAEPPVIRLPVEAAPVDDEPVRAVTIEDRHVPRPEEAVDGEPAPIWRVGRGVGDMRRRRGGDVHRCESRDAV